MNNSMQNNRKSSISPFHSLLGVILMFPIFGAKAIVLVPLLIVFSIYHYLMIAREDKISIGKAFKEDLPDINFFHVLMFLLILFPLWYPFILANKEQPINKDELLKVEFSKKKESFFPRDIFYNISTYNRKSEEALKAIKKSKTLEVYLKEIGYEVMVIPLEKFETLNKKEFSRKSSSFSTINNTVAKEKKIYYSSTQIYISEGYLKNLEIRFKKLKELTF